MIFAYFLLNKQIFPHWHKLLASTFHSQKFYALQLNLKKCSLVFSRRPTWHDSWNGYSWTRSHHPKEEIIFLSFEIIELPSPDDDSFQKQKVILPRRPLSASQTKYPVKSISDKDTVLKNRKTPHVPHKNQEQAINFSKLANEPESWLSETPSIPCDFHFSR